MKKVHLKVESSRLWLVITQDSGEDRRIGPLYMRDAGQMVNVAGTLATENGCEYIVDDCIIESVLCMIRH